MENKRIAVVGGGLCGLLCCCCLKKEGLEPVCYEMTSQPGGTWCYREESTPGLASIMPTTVINHSKELGAFSDFPPKAEYHNYMRHTEMYRYFLDYCEHHDLLKYVRYNIQVTSVKKTSNYDRNGEWEVTIRDLLTRIESMTVYAGVMVCTGHVNLPKMPTFPDQEVFRGKIIHTHSLKSVAEYKGQNVVVVGMGCSALDAAVETSNVARQVYLSTRNGAWIFKRVGPGGYPIDHYLMRRCLLNTLSFLPRDFISRFLEKFLFDKSFNSNLYRVLPRHHVLSKDPSMSDSIHCKLIMGSVIQKRNIARFTEGGVVFEGEDRETVVDSVIMGTGYTWQFPFLEEGTIVNEDNRIDLYKGIFPPHLPHGTLAIVGFVLPYGPGFPVGEIQCRFAAFCMSGKGKLPSRKVMMKEITKRHKRNMKQFPEDNKQTLRIDVMQYMDDLSSLIGAKPNFCRMFFTDPRLFWKLQLGPCVSYQYRLQGPTSGLEPGKQS